MNEIVEKFRAFQSRSKSGYSSFFERIKKEKRFLSGRQWEKGDDKFVAKTRNRQTVNVIKTQCLSVANSYSQYPYSWKTENDEINKRISDFWKIDSNRFAIQDAVLDVSSFGLGVVAIGSNKDTNGMEVPVVYSITDTNRFLLDNESTERDYSDATETALIDYRSREWIRLNHGYEYLPDERAKLITTCASASQLVPIITYYWMDTDGCHCVTMVNEKVIEGSEIVLKISRIPVFPIFGEATWDDEDKPTYQGLVARSEAVQKIVNMCWTQLVERLQQSPKPTWLTYAESVKDLDTYYKNAGASGNPLLLAQRLANDGKTQLPLPTRLDNTIQYNDVVSVIEGSTNLMTSVTGVDSKGLADMENNVTATAVNYTAHVFKNNIAHFYNAVQIAMKALGDTMMVLLGYPGVKVTVVQGPKELDDLVSARQQITALLPIVDQQYKPKMVLSLLKTYPDNTVLSELYKEMSAQPEPNPELIQAQQLVQLQQQQIQKLTEQIKMLEDQQTNADKSYAFELEKMKLQHQYDLEDEMLKAQLNQGADAEKERAEVTKAQLGVEKEILSLDREKTKTAQTVANAMFANGGMF